MFDARVVNVELNPELLCDEAHQAEGAERIENPARDERRVVALILPRLAGLVMRVDEIPYRVRELVHDGLSY